MKSLVIRCTGEGSHLELTPSCDCGSEEEGIKSELDRSGICGERVLGSWIEVASPAAMKK